MKQFCKAHRLTVFFGLAYLLSWYPWVLALLRGRTSGPNPLGPLVAGLLVTAVISGRAGLREYLGRIVRWRVGAKWYLIALTLPVLLCLGAGILALTLSGPAQLVALSSGKLRELPDRFLFILLFIGLGEEPGWRGFALPQLQTRYTPLVASLILAPFWAIWHLPLIGTEFAGPIVAPFLLSVVGGTLLQTWLFNRTGGSVLLPMLFHAATNAFGAGFLFPLVSGSTLVLLWWTYSLLVVATGFAVVCLSSSRVLLSAPLPAGA